ncbi:MAG: hypothetical protein MRJ65_12370 [Candidatus Brocadiaceae bacterium]|nr:hypothetical protein [Candidatus Brocadiaceae bacterium]
MKPILKILERSRLMVWVIFLYGSAFLLFSSLGTVSSGDDSSDGIESDLSQPVAEVRLSPRPSDGELMRARIFSERLIPESSKEDLNENAKLAAALNRFLRRKDPEDASALTQFLDQNPKSRWTVSLWANLGFFYDYQGYWTKALDAYETCWAQGKKLKEPQIKALVDLVVVNLMERHAGFGHQEEMKRLLQETPVQKYHRFAEREADRYEKKPYG